MANTDIIFGKINAMQTLVDNFPMSLLDFLGLRGKTYTSTFDFVVDVLAAIGVSPYEVVEYLIHEMFSVNVNFKDDIISQIENVEIGNSGILVELEGAVKGILATLLTSLASCAAIPVIPNQARDKYVIGTNFYGSGLTIPVNSIDYAGMFTVSPTSNYGKLYYSVESGLTNSTLYKTFDMNAFLWYVLYNGGNVNSSQPEQNKCMWDSRIYSKATNHDDDSRCTPALWNEWINSEKENFPVDKFGIDPILQIERDHVNSENFRVFIPNQTFNGEDANMYYFNWRYLENINIIKIKAMLLQVAETVMGYDYSSALTVKQQMMKKRIRAAIDNIEISESMETTSDCYYTISNDEVNAMMESMLTQRYDPRTYNGNTLSGTMATYLNGVSTAATSINNITKLVAGLASANPNNNAVIEWNSDFWKEFAYSIVTAIIESFMQPQVMMLIYINFMTLGVIKINKDTPITNNYLCELFVRKILSLERNVIIYVMDWVIGLLMDLVYQKLMPLIYRWAAALVIERMTYWEKLLTEAMIAIKIPTFTVKKNITQTLDDVNYADIITEATTPETSSENC